MAQLTEKYLDAKLDDVIDRLGIIINKTFQEQKDYFDIRFDKLENRVDKLEEQIKRIEVRLEKVEYHLESLSNKVSLHLDLSEKRYLESKRRDAILAKWVKQIADKTGVQVDLAELDKF